MDRYFDVSTIRAYLYLVVRSIGTTLIGTTKQMSYVKARSLFSTFSRDRCTFLSLSSFQIAVNIARLAILSIFQFFKKEFYDLLKSILIFDIYSSSV